MKLDQPLGNPAWAATIIRVVIGFYLVSKGLDELPKPLVEIQRLGPIKDIPPHVSRLISTLLPFFEVAGGALLVAGFWTTLGAVLSTLACAVLVAIHGIYPPEIKIPNKEVLLLGGSAAMLYLGGGFLSIDKMRSGGG